MTKKKCHHGNWLLSVIPWGECGKCHRPIRLILHSILTRCKKHVPPKLRAEIEALNKKGGAE